MQEYMGELKKESKKHIFSMKFQLSIMLGFFCIKHYSWTITNNIQGLSLW